jgi:hypothetical protein
MLRHNSPYPNVSSKQAPFGSRQLASIIAIWEQMPVNVKRHRYT